MSTTFLNMENGASSTLRSDHAAGDGTLKVQTGHGGRFGTTWPARVTAITPSGAVAIYQLSGRSSDNLLVTGPIEGTADIALPAGSIIEMRWTKGAAADITAAIGVLESSAAAGSAGVDGQVQVKNGTGFGAIAGTAIGTNAVALGALSTAAKENSQAFGYWNWALATNAFVAGSLNMASGDCAHAEGLQTSAGYPPLGCTISGVTITINSFYGDVTADFACEDCTNDLVLYGLTGGTGPNVAVGTIDGSSTGNGATFNGTNTILKLTSVITNHTTGGVISGGKSRAAHAEGLNSVAIVDGTHAQGIYGYADVSGKSAIGGGGWVSTDHINKSGTCQKSTLVIGGISMDTSPVILNVQESLRSRIPIVRPGCTYSFLATITARKIGGSAHAMFVRRGLIHNEAGATALVGAVQTIGTDINTPGWTVTITADDVNDAIQVSVVGETIVHWNCCLECGEVG